jgi:imidazolonepropionase
VTADLVVRGITRLLTMDPRLDGLGVVFEATVAFDSGKVCYVGNDAGAPSGRLEISGAGRLGLPGLVDCHTHMVWAGSRAEEFKRRLAGESYSAILEAGGGILSTVRHTREASDEHLLEVTTGRLREALERGITTVEIKSGYGLSAKHEVRCLRIAREAGQRAGVRVLTTFLGAHAVPPEWRPDRAGYVNDVVTKQLPAVVDLADYVDVYVDRGAFTVEDGRRILLAARDAGLGLRIHAEQVEHTGSAAMAAELGALSADHLERLDRDGAEKMAKAGTVAVLLPGAMLYLRDTAPPVELLRELGVPMAVATDLNPGSSPTGDLWACATLACVCMGLTVHEALLGITRVAGQALGRPDLGVIRSGGSGDLVLMQVPAGEPLHEDVLVQRLHGHRAALVVRDGKVVEES